MKSFFSPAPIKLHKALASIRITIGLLMIYHGLEIFDAEVMKSYMEWDIFKEPGGKVWVYFGKSSELISGLLLALGLFTRIGALLLVGTLSYITFFVGEGRFWYEDQHPFLFVLFGLLFLFTGPCAWSLDGMIFKNKK